MDKPSAQLGSVATRVGAAGGALGAGLAIPSILTHDNSGLIAAAAVAIAATIPKIIEAIGKHRTDVITAESQALSSSARAIAQLITAASEAEAMSIRTQTRADLLTAGLDPARTEQARQMLRQQPLDTDLPQHRRLNDEALAKLLAPPMPPNGGRSPHSGATGVVVPIRPDDLAHRTAKEAAERFTSRPPPLS